MANPQKIKILRDKKGQFVRGCNIAILNKGIKKPLDFGAKVSAYRKGKKFSLGTKQKISIAMQGNKNGIGNKSHSNLLGEKSPHWIKDRTQIKRQTERNNPNDKKWKYDVYKRDKWRCKLANKDCKGRLEAHHILSWKDYPELRYVVNNGITLCRAHHPRKRAEEKRLIPVFMELVSVSKT